MIKNCKENVTKVEKNVSRVGKNATIVGKKVGNWRGKKCMIGLLGPLCWAWSCTLREHQYSQEEVDSHNQGHCQKICRNASLQVQNSKESLQQRLSSISNAYPYIGLVRVTSLLGP